MEVGLIKKVDIDHEMQQSYLDYAMSVIVARALPDARDGLKPVQRRILYAMYDMGLRADSDYKKSARIVGEVLGKYHPHGDVAVYESMARLAQDFSMRAPLVDGQGNFGSVDGDPPAAMRYTEARLMPFAMELLSQLDRDTVDFAPNFDQSMREPLVLPAALPNLLINGATGIAVGMATSIPPHNTTEVLDALQYMLQRWEKMDDISVPDLMEFVKGPDFPTGGIILQETGENDLQAAYASGRGKVMVRGRVHTEDMGRGKSRLIITELPYMTNKSSLIERIAELVREGVIEGIGDLRDESDRQGMRIVIELNKAADNDKVIRALYQHTPLQSTFSIALLALVNDEPRTLTLKQALRVYLEHRIEVIRRRSQYDLDKAKARAHILEGLRVAINNLDAIIALIKAAPDVETARQRLIKQFKLSEIQAQAILDMQLRRLAALERKKIETEYKDLQKLIGELEALLRSPKKIRELVGSELVQMRATYADRRRTQIVSLKDGETHKTLLTVRDVTPSQEVWVGVTADGLIGRMDLDKSPKMGGRGSPILAARTHTHQTLYLTLADGKTVAVSVDTLPKVNQWDEGQPLYKASPLREKEMPVALFCVPAGIPQDDGHFVLTVTAGGLIKKSAVSELPGASTQPFQLVKVNADDELVRVLLTSGNDHLVLFSSDGLGIRFSEQEVRPMGLVAAGVNGMKLKETDNIAAAERLTDGDELFLISSDGKAWRMPESEFPVQGRYGQGVITCKLANDAVLVGCSVVKKGQPAVAIFFKSTALSIKLDSVISGKRARAGTSLTDVKTGDHVVGLAVLEDALSYWDPTAAPALDEKPKRKRSGGDASPTIQNNGGGASKAAKPAGKVTGRKAAPVTPAGKSETKTGGRPTAAATPVKGRKTTAKAEKPGAGKKATPAGNKKSQPVTQTPPKKKSVRTVDVTQPELLSLNAEESTRASSSRRKKAEGEPYTSTPADKKRTGKGTPAGNQPAQKKPAGKNPAVKKPAGENPAEPKPSKKKPAS